MSKILTSLLGVGLVVVAFTSITLAGTYDLTVDRVTIDTGAFTKPSIGYNGSTPGPVLRFKEGEEVTINVTNNLSEPTSIHWHGLILPFDQDGVPGISYPGIAPSEKFTARFTIVQSGSYWFHSHSGFQESDGAYGAIIIEPKEHEPFQYDREYVIQLTDAHPHSGDRIMRNLKMMSDYYSRQQRTLPDFLNTVQKQGLMATLSDRAAWGDMRMMPTDVEDLQGFTPLINGRSPKQNWTGLFKPGERVRLRFINSSAMTYFDIRISGLPMMVVQADGNNVQPVTVDEFRIAVAETYDVIVQPMMDKVYSILAESMGRSAIARGTLAPREGLKDEIPIPDLRPLTFLTMADMSMPHEGMDHDARLDNDDPFYAAGSGLTPIAANNGKFLSYADLKAYKPLYTHREATREIELRLTGNMNRYIWSMNNVKYADAEPIRLQYGERVRFKFVNDTMMVHPMHLHGMWSILENNNGAWNPAKHIISVAPGTTVYMETEVDAPGQWAFHCHLAYHAASGMFRKVIVEGGKANETATLSSN